jgi:hypothetical protein
MTSKDDAKIADGVWPGGMSSPMIAWWRSMAILPMTMGVEGMRFASRRLLAHADNLTALSQCKSLSDAAMAQSRFAERMVTDYRDEAELVVREVQEAMPTSRAA